MIAPTDDSRLAELLLRWEELHEQGRSLSAEELCSTCPELAEELGRRIALLRRLEPLLDDTGVAPGDPPRPDLVTSRESATAQAEYRDLRFHAAGALGEVFLARNAELNREVALKFLKPSRNRDPESLRRFLREAEVTGRLEHPGIVPIYALGADGAGAPCYAMRFIRGETLQDAIDAFHAVEKPGRDPSERSLALREILNRVVSICNTVAYAHSQGILHRDLKPRNVMLGPFDETLVVDWGLAKPFERDEAARDAGEEALTLVSGSREGAGTPTVGMVGTLTYMSPEQAEGRWDVVGPASDVFSLGAILFALLTGQVPYRGRTYAEILEKVKRCEFPGPRQVKPEVPRALEAVVLKAMAAEPTARYASPLDLAADVRRWLADEPVSAWREPLTVRARRWIRRHQRLVAGATASALVGVVAMAAMVVVVTASNRTIERERDQARDVTEFLVSSFRKPDPAEDGRSVTVAEVLGRAVKELEGRPKMARATRATILGAVGQTYRSLGMVAENLDVAERAFAIRLRVLGEGHPDTLESMNDLAVACYDAGLFERAIPLHERVLGLRRVRLGEGHPDTLESMSNLAAACCGARQLDRAIELHQRALAARKAALGEDHPDTLTSMNNLAATYYDQGSFDRAIPLHEHALRARTAGLGEDHPDTLGSMTNLAVAYTAAGQLDLAIPLCQRVFDLQRARLGEDHRDTLTSMNNLGVAWERAGHRDRAIPLYERLIALRLAKLGEDHPDTLISMTNLAMAYWAAGQFDRLLPLCERVVAVRQARLGENHPDTLEWKKNLAMAYMAAGRFDRLIPFCEREAAARQSKLGKDHPDALAWASHLAKVYESAGQGDRAIALHERVAAARKAGLGEDHPETLVARKDLAWSYHQAGRYRESAAVCRNLAEAAGRSKPRDVPLYCESLAMLGDCQSRLGEHADAVSLLGGCLKLMEETHPDDWITASYRSGLGGALSRQRSFAEAERHLLAGHQGLVQRSEKIPPQHRAEALRRAVNRLVELYELWGKPAEADRWRKTLPQAPPRPAESREAQAAAVSPHGP